MATEHELPILDGELVDLDALNPQPLQHPPAVRGRCACGKDGSPKAHGAIPYQDRILRPFTCAEVLEIAASVEAARSRRRRWLHLFGGS